MTFEQFTTRLDDMVSFRCSKVANIDDLDKIADICYECKLKECYDHDIYSYTGFYDKYVVVENGGYEIAVFDIDIVSPKMAVNILKNGAENPTRVTSTNIVIGTGEEWLPTLVDTIELCYIDVGTNRYYFDDQRYYGGFTRFIKHIINENSLSFEDTLRLANVLEE